MAAPQYAYYTSEAGVLSALRSGDPMAMRAIFLMHFRPLCFYIERLTGSPEDAEDIAASTFAKAWDRKQQFETMDNVRAFLYRAARNLALNEQRDQQRHQAAHEQLRYLTRDELFSEETLEEEFIRAELLSEIYREVENLPEKCREIFKLLFFERLSTEEAAARLGLAAQTVRSQKSRAIRLLRVQLLKKGSLLTIWYLIYLLINN
jgi:RNA polymerase sigma-70 factor (family 1)